MLWGIAREQLQGHTAAIPTWTSSWTWSGLIAAKRAAACDIDHQDVALLEQT
jgi:hypothetical protein